MRESEMEELLATYPDEFFPRKILVLKGRQTSFAGVGRFDLLFEDEHRTNVLVELKARVAKYEDASQIAKYKTALEDRGERNVIMWLIAPLIPRPVVEFLDSIGIEHTEIHEVEFRNVASRHNLNIQSESKHSPEIFVPENRQIRRLAGVAEPKTEWSFGSKQMASGNAAEFLARCDDGAKAFFTTFFDHQKTIANRSQITWNHESGFSMKVGFKKLGYVELIWGFPAVNRDGANSRNKQCLVFPFDFAFRRRVPQEFLISFAQALSEGVQLAGGPKRPSIAVSALSPA